MKKRALSLIGLLLSMTSLSLAQEINTEVSTTWTTQSSGEMTATCSVEKAFKTIEYTPGKELTTKGSATLSGITFSKLQPSAKTSGSVDGHHVLFAITPTAGLQFTPRQVAFKAARFGTGGGLINVAIIRGDGSEEQIASAVVPNRDNATPNHTVWSFDIPQATTSSETFYLKAYIYNLDNTKQVGFADVVLSGQIQGSIIDVPRFSLSALPSPTAGGSIEMRPKGEMFDQGTEVTLNATRNFGYRFVQWADASGQTVSTDPEIVHTVTANAALTAQFEAINTYSLDLSVSGGAAPYMVECQPEGTLVNGKRMYEEGTSVKLTAAGNPILTFTHWDSNETDPIKNITMTQNQIIGAIYSAADFIAGWDFYRLGNNSRTADFASEGNDVSTLVLRNAAGTIQGWLDKSQQAGGYEGRPGAVNWKSINDNYYYQISFDASRFTDIHVASAMLLNYNAYSVQQIEYSLDGENFTPIGSITLSATKTWYDSLFPLPAQANNASKVYVRWIPDYNSPIIGASSNTDGTALSGIYVTGTIQLPDDGKAPILQQSIPVEAAENISASGKIVLTFDKNIQIAPDAHATLGTQSIVPTVSGKTLTFAYIGLDYNSNYTFTLPANLISDLNGNTLTESIAINFQTMNRPVVDKRPFDAIVSNAEELLNALEQAKASTSGQRFRILLKDGEYNLGSGITAITAHNISLVGQSYDNVLIYNQSIEEGIGITSTLYLDKASGFYGQDLRIQNKYPYVEGVSAGRAVVLRDTGTKNIFKNVGLFSFQDTYYSGNSGRMYFEEGEIHGVVDFICGGSDIFFNRVKLVLEERKGNCITAPSGSTPWGYVFNNCTIDAVTPEARTTVNGNFSLGRPWQGAPRSVYLNTTMHVLPRAEGWTDMSTEIVPSLFAEYNSTTASGTPVDLSNRKTEYTAGTVAYNPVLTQEEAAQFTVENVLGGTDGWQPTLYTEQATTPTLASDDDRTLTWAADPYAGCYVLFKDGVYLDQTINNSYAVPADGSYTVSAANEMGGLTPRSNAIQIGASNIEQVEFDENERVDVYTIDGRIVLKDVLRKEVKDRLPNGFYIVGGVKLILRK